QPARGDDHERGDDPSRPVGDQRGVATATGHLTLRGVFSVTAPTFPGGLTTRDGPASGTPAAISGPWWRATAGRDPAGRSGRRCSWPGAARAGRSAGPATPW